MIFKCFCNFILYFKIIFFFFLAAHTSYERSWVMDQTQVTAAPHAATVTMPDFLPAAPQENSPVQFFFFLKREDRSHTRSGNYNDTNLLNINIRSQKKQHNAF